MSNEISRRSVLKGLGATVALPLLDAMIPTTAMAMSQGKPAVRMAFLFVPNGINMRHWRPGEAGNLGALPKTLQPLNDFKSQMSVLTGLTQRNATALGDGPGDHARSAAAWLTGVHPRKTAGKDISLGVSADQVAAARIGNQTKYASLELGCERGGIAGDCDSGYSCAYSQNISWKGEFTPNSKETNPRVLFERLFGSGDEFADAASQAQRQRYNKSILDFVLDDAKSLSGKVGIADQRKLEEYLESVREIEQRLTKFQSDNKVPIGAKMPEGKPDDLAKHIQLMGDMMILAFQTDLTRVCTFMFCNEGSNRPYPMIGVSEGHHEISHHGNNDAKLTAKQAIDQFHIEQLAYIIRRMSQIKEGTGTLLDNSMIVYGGGISDGNAHNHDDLPILFAGRGGGVVKTGKHVVYQNGTPLNNLYLGMMDKVGIPVETLGDSTGKIAPLF